MKKRKRYYGVTFKGSFGKKRVFVHKGITGVRMLGTKKQAQKEQIFLKKEGFVGSPKVVLVRRLTKTEKKFM